MVSPSEHNVILTDRSYSKKRWGASAVIFNIHSEILFTYSLGGDINSYNFNEYDYVKFCELMGVYCSIILLVEYYTYFNKTCVIVTDNMDVYKMLHLCNEPSIFNNIVNIIIFKLLMAMITTKKQIKILFKNKLNNDILQYVLRETELYNMLINIKSHEWPPHIGAKNARIKQNDNIHRIIDLNNPLLYNVFNKNYMMLRRNFIKISYKNIIKNNNDLFQLIMFNFNNIINYDVNKNHLRMVGWLYYDDNEMPYFYCYNTGAIILLDIDSYESCLNYEWKCYHSDKIKIWHNNITYEWFYIINENLNNCVGYIPYNNCKEKSIDEIMKTPYTIYNNNGNMLYHCNNGDWCNFTYQ